MTTLIRMSKTRLVYSTPILVHPKAVSTIDGILTAAWHGPQSKTPLQVGSEVIELQRMKPDGKGGIIPR